MNFSKKLILLCLLLVVRVSWAQNIDDSTSIIDSTKSKSYPIIKLFGVSYDALGPTDYEANIDGHEIHKGTVRGGSLLAYGSFFLLNKPKHIISLTEVYRREFIELNDLENPFYEGQGTKYNFNSFSTSINYTNRTKWKGKPLISTVSTYVTTSDLGRIDKVSGIITSTMVFQKKPETRYTLGVAILADLSTSTPLFPVVSYWHQFKNPSWEISAVLPKEVYLRKNNILGGWLSAGSELISKSYFLYNLPGRFGTFENRLTEIQTGLKYEYITNEGIMLSVGAGYRNVAQNNIIEVYKPNRDKIVNMTYNGGWFAKVELSFVIQSLKK
ncbi:hypothetical protein [Neptunitalea lumnitzerae]|uniref:Uncharacterized protein n=1 Tax=Neptunitalea lumnitzerae TaxID=2965509 RepID=A0ABQ5MKK2_9FLAO|nr:hypothetical protein [Neptunitalea sp. Y10]GLB49580.1 hypothetical protein Y10_19480 [Neptunitalea sp. Y10]